MVGRSLRASAEGIQIIRKAIKRDGWKQEELKEELALKTRQPITRLLRGETIERSTFEELCHLLSIEVDDVAEPETENLPTVIEENIDNLVQEVRDRIKPLIEQACGTMRVLDMSYPIGLDNIYTDVNILERITSRRGLELAEMMREAGREQFDRFCLGDVREERVPGLVAVERFPKLMILGKPGAGKTTFLKRLAMQCIGGKFKSEHVPVFVTLKEFAEEEGKPSLLKYLSERAGESFETIVKAGRAMILLDGLDEVREVDGDRVLRQIKTFSQQFAQNCFVITCRIAAKEYTFEQFTEVEVADFDDTQIAEFSNNWFRSRNDAVKAERFLARLKEDKPIRELATSPLLLTLLCLVFENSGDFPTNRAELYQNGVDVLLKKWDVKRNIERDRVYKGLSLKRKEALLGQIARKTFEAGNYFFKQREAERYISEYIQNLPDTSTDPEALEVDSADVLKSIEAHHGLFVERARGIYSFSHLTFHEYFTAYRIFTICNQYSTEDPILGYLASRITESRWQEVIALTVNMLDSADALLKLVKQNADLIVASEEEQNFLTWVALKSALTEAKMKSKKEYKIAAIRAFYFQFGLTLFKQLGRYPDISLANSIDSDFTSDLGVKEIDPNCDSVRNIALDLYLHYAVDRTFERAEDALSGSSLEGGMDSIRNIELAIQFAVSEDLKEDLRKLKSLFYKPESDPKVRMQWWKDNHQWWVNSLLEVIRKHQHIGYLWEFSDVQFKKLQQYYNTNKLLVYCLNSDCYVSREVRQEIEETLLLPIADIEAWKKNKGNP